MADRSPFSAAEFDGRLAAVRRSMAGIGLDVLVVSSAENIYYLSGLDHWGYFAPHMLIVPAEGGLVLTTRAMEAVTVANQVANVLFQGHSDGESVTDVAVRILREIASSRDRIGIEKGSAGLPVALGEALAAHLPNISWSDSTGLVDALRLVKSPAEQALMRAAAQVSDAAAGAAIEAVRVGASERNVAAACSQAMIAAGGTFPGFGPFIRSTERLGEEHTTWGDAVLAEGDSLFIELAGCVHRYHAPLGRLVHLGRAPQRTYDMARICADAFTAVTEALRPGVLARDVYAAWQAVVDRAGLSHYRRHHCGYLVGIGFPPSWTGGNRVTGLRADSDLEIREGMSFHVLSWLMGTGRGDFFLSNTVLLGPAEAEVLTRAPGGVLER